MLTSCQVCTIVSLLYGLSTSKISWIPIVVSLAVLPLFIIQEVRFARDPIIPVAVLRSRGALLSCLATIGFMMSRWVVLFYAPIYATAVRGWGPAKAGSMIVPTNIGFAVGGLTAGYFHIRRDGSFYTACLVIFALFSSTELALALSASDTTPIWILLAFIFANGLFAGAALNYTLIHVLFLVPDHVKFIVTSLMATFRGFAATFGSAIGGGVFIRVLGGALEKGFKERGIEGREALIRELLGSPRVVNELRGVEKEVAVRGYISAIKALWLAGVGMTILSLCAQAGTGWVAEKSGAGADRDDNAGEEGDEDSNGHV